MNLEEFTTELVNQTIERGMADKLNLREPHKYPPDACPSRHPKGSFWATDIAWDILDRLPVGTLDNVQRAFLAGLISGALVKERDRKMRWEREIR